MKEIFVPYEIVTKLKEIGFDEECVGFYADRNEDGDLFDGWKIFMEIDTLSYGESINLTDDFQLFNYNDVGWISVPTWEQVFAWFRDKDAFSYIKKFANKDKFHYVIGDREYFDLFKNYEECREALVLKLIEIYKKNKFQPKIVQNINNNGAIIGNSINIGNINGNIKL